MQIFTLFKYVICSFWHSTLKEILAALDDKLNNADLDGMIAEIDSDGSGTVDFDGKYFNQFNIFKIITFYKFVAQNLWR